LEFWSTNKYKINVFIYTELIMLYQNTYKVRCNKSSPDCYVFILKKLFYPEIRQKT